MTSYAAAPKDLEEALKLIQEKKVLVRDMVTHRFPLEEAGKGFETMLSPDSLKVIIEPNK